MKFEELEIIYKREHTRYETGLGFITEKVFRIISIDGDVYNLRQEGLLPSDGIIPEELQVSLEELNKNYFKWNPDKFAKWLRVGDLICEASKGFREAPLYRVKDFDDNILTAELVVPSDKYPDSSEELKITVKDIDDRLYYKIENI